MIFFWVHETKEFMPTYKKKLELKFAIKQVNLWF